MRRPCTRTNTHCRIDAHLSCWWDYEHLHMSHFWQTGYLCVHTYIRVTLLHISWFVLSAELFCVSASVFVRLPLSKIVFVFQCECVSVSMNIHGSACESTSVYFICLLFTCIFRCLPVMRASANHESEVGKSFLRTIDWTLQILLWGQATQLKSIVKITI